MQIQVFTEYRIVVEESSIQFRHLSAVRTDGRCFIAPADGFDDGVNRRDQRLFLLAKTVVFQGHRSVAAFLVVSTFLPPAVIQKQCQGEQQRDDNENPKSCEQKVQ